MAPPDLAAKLPALTSPHRRSVCRYFLTSDDDVADLVDLAEFVLEEAGGGPRSSSHSERSVATELYHIHLPQLDAAGVLSFDSANRTVRYHGDPVLEGLLAELDEGGAAAVCR